MVKYMADKFKINNKIREDLNNRVFLFHNETNENKEKVEIISIENKEVQYLRENHYGNILHLEYFNYYLNSHYLGDKTLQKYNQTCQQLNTIFFFLVSNEKDMIFLETTELNSKYRTGLLCIPDSIDEIQRKNFEGIKNHIKGLAEIIVLTDFYITEQATVDNKFIETFKNKDFDKLDKIVDSFYNKEKNKAI